MSATAMSLGLLPQGNGEPGAAVKCPLPSPSRTLMVSSVVLATIMSGLPSWFTSAMAIEPGPFPMGITIRLKLPDAGALEGRSDAAMARAARSAVARPMVMDAVFTVVLARNCGAGELHRILGASHRLTRTMLNFGTIR